jgi:S1-C subfamily serine protease
MANRRQLGVQLEELTVTEVQDDGAGKKAGMQEGDEIVKADGTKVADRMELGRALRGGAAKKVVTVRRAGNEIDLSLTWETPAPEKNEAEKKAP